ncbi:MAG: hypothetical protein QXV06_07900 [Ignisphaera sp.]
MVKSTVLLILALILISLSIQLLSLTLSSESSSRLAIEVRDYVINGTVVFRMFRLNKIVFVIFNRDLMLDLGDGV